MLGCEVWKPLLNILAIPEGHESSRAATALLTRFDRKPRNWWSEAVQNIDFSHSSRVAWSTLNNLTGKSRQSRRKYPISANAIASQQVKNGKYDGANWEIFCSVMEKLSDLWWATSPDAMNISEDFSPRKFAVDLHHLKLGQAPGPDSICLEFLIHAGPGLKFWQCGFLSSCLRQLKIPKVWRRALIVAIPKPSKPVEDPKSYHAISLLCVPYKILERLIYNCVEPVVDPLLPKEQAGFWHGKSTVD